MSMPPTFRCSCCDAELPGPPLSWHIAAPDAWSVLSERERAARTEINGEQCIIDDEHFFVRGVLEIPLLDGEGPFLWDTWVSLSRTNFERMSDLWESSDRALEPPYFGWYSNRLPIYPDTLNLKAHVRTRAVGLRPLIELERTDHPLSIEQRNGITTARVREIAELIYHDGLVGHVPQGFLGRMRSWLN